MPAPLPPPAGTAGTILLVEEYAALAAAIVFALRKFAPDNETRVARSLTEAETLVSDLRPELFIIDFDPPQPDIIDFLERMKSAAADARALVITAGSAEEALQHRSRPAALQFVEKPFEVRQLGAAVQALLGAVADSASDRTLGTMRDLTVADVVPLLCLAGETAVVKVRTSKETGEIHLSRGQIGHASTDTERGVLALHEMLHWERPVFSASYERSEAACTIGEPWPAVFAAALRATAQTPAPSISAVDAKRAGKKIVVIEDTEMLRVFVNEMLITADPSLHITAAADGTAGVKQVAQVQPDLVLLDYSLPDFNGNEVCRRLRDQSITASIPVIMMSGHVPEMTAAAARYENIVAALPKPFLSAALIELVQSHLRAPRVIPPLVQDEKEEPAPVVAEPETAGTPLAAPLLTSTLTPARIVSGQSNTVVVGFSVEAQSMSFSAALKLRIVQALPSSSLVSLRQNLHASSSAGFELARAVLDKTGQLRRIHLTRREDRPVAHDTATAGLSIANLAFVTAEGTETFQLIPATTAPMKLQLLALFEIVGVELSPSFGATTLIMEARSAKVRVSQQGQQTGAGATFLIRDVKLNPAGGIAELLLHASA